LSGAKDEVLLTAIAQNLRRLAKLGHILMIVRRIAQTEDAAGIILAVDGKPDGTIARKRFWSGNFLFAQDPALGGRFRPVVAANGAMRRLINAESDTRRVARKTGRPRRRTFLPCVGLAIADAGRAACQL
jgi:hypothetical protein